MPLIKSVCEAIIVFFSQLGGYSHCPRHSIYCLANSASAITIPVGQTILVNSLASDVSKHVPGISPQLVVHAGATNLKSLTTDKMILRAIQAAYSQAVTNVLYFSLAALTVAMPFALCMEWKNLKEPNADDMEHQNLEGSPSSVRSQEAVGPGKLD